MLEPGLLVIARRRKRYEPNVHPYLWVIVGQDDQGPLGRRWVRTRREFEDVTRPLVVVRTADRADMAHWEVPATGNGDGTWSALDTAME